MADNSIIKTTGHMVTEKKLNEWNNRNNFVGAEELTVTITLDEYRDLLTSVERLRAEKTASELFETRKQLEKATEENIELKEILGELQDFGIKEQK